MKRDNAVKVVTRRRPVPDYIVKFFGQYPEFDYDPDASFIDELYRMLDYYGWDRDSDEREEARDAMRRAMVLQFNDTFGTNAEDLASWQKLCEIIQIDPVPSDLEKCRRAVVTSHINICDLLDAPFLGTAPIRFPTEVALILYRAKSTSTKAKSKVASHPAIQAARPVQTAKAVKKVTQAIKAPKRKRDFIDLFFARYRAFNYRPTAPFLEEFKRLKEHENWDEKEEKQARGKLQEAMVEQFSRMYGRHEDDLRAWQRLCNALGVKRIPKTLAGCQRLVTRRTHVNLVDFIRRDPSQPVPTFLSEVDLSRYTHKTEKYYSREAAKASKPELNHIHAYFAQYPEFDYQLDAPFLKEFRRLLRVKGWNNDPVRRKAEWDDIHDAMVLQFNTMYGRSAGDLSAWQSLCAALGVDPIPDSIKQCRKIVKGTHVNLVDFVERRDLDQPVRVFPSEHALAEYSKKHKKIFSKSQCQRREPPERLVKEDIPPAS
ncbi:hypothetical protein L226DRAFT_571306 [Lentinus tigrinus ALCF2SS1-7]|uniref:Uncharacterized protein n=1 Tax=Lentinus tigrinus ALCF2SS1-6 TaxID=1328759 RepID=A0A5C2SDU3_9APHY|nr:hypothetical protein L227DRAFT_609790 [Lentinus tigrinus ALCF2SS1-6]RPD74407.1 hypothetical protein L226DRAFT_571306 [Lentinus tigrinus ALCF2SS1-7]